MNRKKGPGLNYFWGILLFVIIWHIASRYNSQYLLPDVNSVFSSLLDNILTGIFLQRALETIVKVFIGLLISLGVGFILGIAMHLVRIIRNIFSPWLTIMESAPPISWIVLAIVWFGISNIPPILVLVLTIVPIIANATLSAVATTERKYSDLITIYPIRLKYRLIYIYTPAVLTSIVCSLRISLGLSWRLVATAEFFASANGLGYELSWAHANLDTIQILAITILLIILSLLSEWFLIMPLEKRVSQWKL